MSEESAKGSKAANAVLLPAAKVALHVNDAEMREVARKLSGDWRFARITFDINEGTIESAIQKYQNTPSPELVIVETPTIEDGFTERLEVLAGNCSDNTSAVVVGPVNDVYLYRKLIDMGVSDYLVRPISAEVLGDVISKTLIEKFGTPDSRLIAVVGAKGGVGTSTIAEEIARTMSDKLDEKTIIVDAAGGWSYLSVAMGTEPMTNFNEAARLAASADEAAFRRMIYNVSNKLSVLATGSEALLDDHSSADHFEVILNKLMMTYPVVIVDLSGASAHIKKMVISRAHNTLVVSTPALSSLRSARTLMHEIKNYRGDSGDNIELILNKIGEAQGTEVNKADIEKALDRKSGFSVSYDSKVFAAAETQGKAIRDVKGGEIFAANLVEFLKKITNSKEAVPAAKAADSSAIGSLLSKLKAK